MSVITEATIYGISIAGLGFLGLVVRYCFKSKCVNVSCCFGLIKIERDIEHEVIQQIEEEKNENKNEISMRNVNNV